MAKSFAELFLEAQRGGPSVLDRASTRYENNRGILERLGSVPRAGMGLLARVAAPLDYLGGIARAGIFSVANEGLGGVFKPAGIDINMSGDTSDDYSILSNMKRAILQNPFDPKQPIAGFGEVPGLQWQDDDRFITKALKGTAAFGLDVASDPLTYLTLGVGPLAKKAALKVVGTKTAAEATEILGREIAEKGSREAAEKILEDSPRIVNAALTQFTDDALSQSQKVSKYLSTLGADDLAREAGEELGARATAVLRGPGRGALRTYLYSVGKETGVDDFKRLFDKFADDGLDDIVGGFRITTPTGKTIKRLTPGGVSPIEPIRAQLGAKFGATTAGQALTLGADRALTQGAKKAAAVLAKEAVGSEAFQTVLRKAAGHESQRIALQAGRAAGRQGAVAISREAQELVANHQASIARLEAEVPGRGQLLQDLTSKYHQQFELAPSQRAFDEDGVLRIAVPDDEKAIHELAVATAQKMIDSDVGTYIANKQKFGGAFSEAGVRQGPARVMTKEAREFSKQIDTQTPGTRSTGKFKASENYFLIDPETGLRRRMTIDEANEAVRQNLLKRGFAEEDLPKKWFETDATTVYLASMDKIARRIEKVSPIQALQKKGLLVSLDSIGGIDPKVVDERAAKTIRDLADQIDQALKAGNRTEADEILGDANELQGLVDEAWTMAGAAQNEAFANVMEQIVKLKGAEARRLESALGATAPETKAVRAAYTRMRNELAKTDAQFAENLRGMSRLGTLEGADGELIRIQDEFMNLFAQRELADALTNAIRVYPEMGPVMKQFEAVLAGWRRAFTIGRGPAFVLRNLGTWWNNVVAGATRADMSDAVRYMMLREAAIKEYKQLLPTIDIRQLNTTKVASMRGVDEALIDEAVVGESLLDELLRKQMKDQTLGGVDMYKAHLMMERQGIFGSSLTDTAIGRDDQGIPKDISARTIVGRGRSSVFSQTRKGEVIPLKELRKQGLTLREIAGSGDRRIAARTLDSAVNNPLVYGNAWLSEQSEVWLRSTSFATGLRRYGGDEIGGELAGILTKATQFDYRDMSEMEKRYIRQIAPFYIWTKNNVPFQLRALLASPGKVNMVLRGNETVKDLLGSDDEQLNEYLPGWLTEQLGFASSLKSGDNNMALGLNLPLADLNRMIVVPDSLPTSPGALKESIQAVLGGTRDDAVGSLNPFAKALMETITGTNTFTQTPFTDTAAGPLFSRIPGATWIDPETGRREGSGYAQSQMKNLLPFFGQAERLLPGSLGAEGVENERLVGNWLSQATAGLPISINATLTESQLAGELRGRNKELEARIKREARKLGVTTEELRKAYDDETNFSRLFKTGAGSDTSFARAFLQVSKRRNTTVAAALAP